MRPGKITRTLNQLDDEFEKYTATPTERQMSLIDSGRLSIAISRETENSVRTRCGWTICAVLFMAGIQCGDPVVGYYVGMGAYPVLLISLVRTAMKKKIVHQQLKCAQKFLAEITQKVNENQKQE